MERRLTHLFDFQRFVQNPVLQSMIDNTESRYGISELADDDLADLAAAGEGVHPVNPFHPHSQKGEV